MSVKITAVPEFYEFLVKEGLTHPSPSISVVKSGSICEDWLFDYEIDLPPHLNESLHFECHIPSYKQTIDLVRDYMNIKPAYHTGSEYPSFIRHYAAPTKNMLDHLYSNPPAICWNWFENLKSCQGNSDGLSRC